MIIYIEDLVANALIELIERHNVREISLGSLKKYGDTVVEKLEERNIEAFVLIYGEIVAAFIEDYNYLFNVFTINNKTYFQLKNNYDSQYLRDHFRAFQNIETTIAMTNDKCIKTLK